MIRKHATTICLVVLAFAAGIAVNQYSVVTAQRMCREAEDNRCAAVAGHLDLAPREAHHAADARTAIPATLAGEPDAALVPAQGRISLGVTAGAGDAAVRRGGPRDGLGSS